MKGERKKGRERRKKEQLVISISFFEACTFIFRTLIFI